MDSCEEAATVLELAKADIAGEAAKVSSSI